MAACIEAYRTRYAEVSLRDTPAYPGVEEALVEIGAGRRLGVATSKPRAFAEPLLEALGLRGHFEAVAAPDARPARAVQDRDGRGGPGGARARPGAMVGDRHVDMAAAHAHGLRAVGVSWGFGTADELREAHADVIADTPGALPALV